MGDERLTMSNFIDSAVLWLIGIATVAIIFCVGISIYDSTANYDKLVHVEKNTIGCDKYRLHGDEWWVCPKGLNITQITERVRSGKATVKKEIPVIEAES